MSEWILCSEEMPEAGEWVLTSDKDGSMQVLFWSERNEEWTDDYESFLNQEEVTHWQPLPEPPQ